ncbi:MAG: cation-translocating P-type ATPase [Isosphaeraceae bacterium]
MLSRQGVEPERGLDHADARVRRAKYGANQLEQASPPPLWRRFLGQFLEPLVAILLGAAIVSGLLGDAIDGLAILAIVILNGVIGFIQQERAERALAALQRLSAPLAKVLREGRLQSIPARELVPGDLIALEAGDSIPADARLIRSFGLRVQEASLTGESTPVDKDAEDVLDTRTPLGDRSNMVFMGTAVAAGNAEAVVVATGMMTELGQIAGLLRHAGREPTPLQRRLAELGKLLIGLILAVVALIFVLHVFWGGGSLLESLLLSVSLAVSAVPEGMPAVVTLVLAIGLQRLVGRHALIRELPAVETLGSVTVICSDKTGTLTRNEMTVREVVTGSAHYHVSGAGYEPSGGFHPRIPGTDRHVDEAVDPEDRPDLMRALQIAAWCNAAQVTRHPEGGGWRVLGDPTEGALVVAARKADIEATDRAERVLHEIPFDSERRTMSVLVRGLDASATMYTKGAPEAILDRCDREWRHGRIQPLTPERRAEIRQVAAGMAAQALRVLALADRHHPDAEHEAARREEDLIFVGLVGMIDPPRDEARAAVSLCRQAGIRPVMITGDHPVTALAIARDLGIASAADRALSGQDLDERTDDELAELVRDVAVFARVSAEHKLRIVRAWKARGEVVAMTGDGVNDAPAIRAADIGIAMGITGTDVTREASDMVLTDDNFASIVSAVEEGRGIFDNIRKFIHYLLASNVSEVLLMLLAAVVGWPAPLTAVQLLWINLVTDGLPALALGMEPPERDIMRRPPRPPHEPVITRRGGLLILAHGALMATVGVAAFAVTYGPGESLDQARAATFSTLAFTQLFFSFASRSRSLSLPELGPFSNPYLFGAIALSALLQFAVVTLPPARSVFDVPAHHGGHWFYILPFALLPVTIVEVAKLMPGRRAAGRSTPTPPAG